MSKLFKYYSLSECSNSEAVLDELENLCENGKIYYEDENEDLMLEDLDLEEDEIDGLLKMFEEYDVLPNLDREDDEDDEYPDFHGEYEF